MSTTPELDLQMKKLYNKIDSSISLCEDIIDSNGCELMSEYQSGKINSIRKMLNAICSLLEDEF